MALTFWKNSNGRLICNKDKTALIKCNECPCTSGGEEEEKDYILYAHFWITGPHEGSSVSGGLTTPLNRPVAFEDHDDVQSGYSDTFNLDTRKTYYGSFTINNNNQEYPTGIEIHLQDATTLDVITNDSYYDDWDNIDSHYVVEFTIKYTTSGWSLTIS